MNWFQRLFNNPSGTPLASERILKPEAIESVHQPVSRVSPDESYSNFTPRAQQVLAHARREADRFNHNFVGTEHVLLGLIALGRGTAVNVLQKMGVDLNTARDEVEKQVGTGPDQKMIGNIPYTPRVKKVLALAAKEAKQLNHTYIGTEHVLLGLLREGDGVAARVLLNLDVNLEKTRIEILKELDPNFQATEPSTESGDQEKLQSPTALKTKIDPIDVSKRYDVYCIERESHAVVYRNVRFKGARSLFPNQLALSRSDFFELEHADGTVVHVAAYSVVKFCEPGVLPRGEIFP